jgi:hypothetical protein
LNLRTRHPNPAEAHRRWRGRGAGPDRLAVRHHHRRSLCGRSPAQSEQWLASLAAAASSYRRKLLSSGARPGLRIANVAAQTRIVSAARPRLELWKSVRPFKGIFCDDISEFESYMPSQPVASPWPMSAPQKYTHHARGLETCGAVSHLAARAGHAAQILSRCRESCSKMPKSGHRFRKIMFHE